MVKVVTVKSRCPLCGGVGCVFRAGFYYTRAKPRKRNRFKCKGCLRGFNLRRRVYFGLDYDLKVLREIERLVFCKKNSFNKFDNKKSFNYSSREIARIVGNKFKTKVSKSQAWFLVRRFRENRKDS